MAGVRAPATAHVHSNFSALDDWRYPFPPMAGAEEEEEQAPEANAVMGGEAESQVIESGGADNSSEFESTTNTDESVHVNVIVPPAEEAGADEHTHAELEHCEHCAAHEAAIAALTSELAALKEAAAPGVEEEEAPPEGEAPPAPPASGAEQNEERRPKREFWLYKRPFHRGDE